MCHPGLDAAVRSAATTGPRCAATLMRKGATMPAIDRVALEVTEEAGPDPARPAGEASSA
jgi:hypothetical protein